MVVLVLFNEHPKNIHERGEGVIFLLTHFIHQTVEQCHQLAIFTLRARNMDRWLDLRPSSKGYFHLRVRHKAVSQLPLRRSAGL